MKIIFCGTPAFALPPLQALIDSSHTVVAVFTQPDKPAGRGRKLSASPVKQLAEAHGITVHQPVSLKDASTQAMIRALDADLMVVVAYGLLLPQAVLDTPRHGCWNIHASLLPRWRGAAPIQRAILAGDEETGVCIMRMEAGLDTGPVYHRATTPIGAHEHSNDLHDRLSTLGAHALMHCVDLLQQDQLPSPLAQDDAAATYAHKIKKDEARIDWSAPATAIDRRIRAFDPWPGCEATVCGVQCKLWAAEVHEVAGEKTQPGALLSANAQRLVIACGEDALCILEIQLPGKKRLPIEAFMAARRDWYT